MEMARTRWRGGAGEERAPPLLLDGRDAAPSVATFLVDEKGAAAGLAEEEADAPRALSAGLVASRMER